MADLQLVDYEGEDTQKVAVLDEPYKMSIQNAKIPVPADNEVRVKIKWVGICGSDLEAYRGTRAPEFVSIPARLGNLVTNINADEILGEFPHENFCDLHFYDLMQSSRIMKPEMINEVFGVKAKAVVESFSKMPVVQEAESIVQDPNAIKEQKGVAVKSFNARQQGYLLKINERVAITTMKLYDNASGIGLLKEIIKNV